MSRRLNLILVTSSIILNSCNSSKNDDNNGLDGEYMYSTPSNLSYYIPEGFKDAYIETESQYDSLISTIYNDEIKESLKLFYYTDYFTNPETLGAYYLYKEDSLNYTFMVISETDHIRLNEKNMDYFKAYRNSIINNTAGDSTVTIELTDDLFSNKSHHQIMTTRGITDVKDDSFYWEYFLVSQFMQTYSVFTKSNTEFNFKPYIHTVRYGDKTAIE